MNRADLIVLAALAACVILALRRIRKTRRSGGCSCGCAGCSGCDNPAQTRICAKKGPRTEGRPSARAGLLQRTR